LCGVALTTKRYEAERMKKHLTKYFKHRLKLELSDEKTKIADMKRDGAEFLGFVIRAKQPRGKGPGTVVGKPFPNMKRLSVKIGNVCSEIHAMKQMKHTSDRVAQIQHFNSMIMGIAEYIKIGICSHAFSVIDHHIYISCHYTWKRLYPDSAMYMKIPLSRLSNLPHRHEGHTAKTHAIKYQDMWIGITMTFITHSQHEKLPMNQKMTPIRRRGGLFTFDSAKVRNRCP